MEIPEFIDSEVINSPWFWIFFAASEISFLVGFKLAANGLFGVAAGAETYDIPFLTKLMILAIDPLIVYIISLKFFA